MWLSPLVSGDAGAKWQDEAVGLEIGLGELPFREGEGKEADDFRVLPFSVVVGEGGVS